MEAADGLARCPRCGHNEPAACRSVFVVTGASGSGKTTLYPLVAAALARQCVTFDVDLLIDSASAFNPGQPIHWPAFRDAWFAVAHGVAQSGLPTVLFGPLIPAHLDELPARRWVGDVHFLVLDCGDDLRRQRIESRPPWRGRDITEQVEFGRWLRENIADSVDTGVLTPPEAASRVCDWVLSYLDDANG